MRDIEKIEHTSRQSKLYNRIVSAAAIPTMVTPRVSTIFARLASKLSECDKYASQS